MEDTIRILRDNDICDRFNIISEEKENRHYHILIMPRHQWMIDLFGDIMTNIGRIFDYAKNNLRTGGVFKQIDDSAKILKEEIAKKYFNFSGRSKI